jgi:outer membrane protein OmpA-like peptidoglycan-associated protein
MLEVRGAGVNVASCVNMPDLSASLPFRFDMSMKTATALALTGISLWLPVAAFGQTPAAPTPRASTEEARRPATTTASGTTGLWFVPTAEVLAHKKWSLSLYRTNFDDGEGFSDMSTFPVTFAVGLGNRAELFGNLATVVRIDRDTRPLFFTNSADTINTGSGGGVLVNYPLVREGWIGNRLGDLSVGGKVNLLNSSTSPLAVGVKALVKLPTGDDEAGASSGKPDFQGDLIVSGYGKYAELSAYGGFMARGNPDGFKLTNGIRWGMGAAFPQKYNLGFKITAEVFGEKYLNDTITAPANFAGADGSIAPITSDVKSPIYTSLGLTWQAPNGFFVGAAGSWNVTMKGRQSASCAPGLVCPAFNNDQQTDDKGLQIRIGYHPGARDRRYVAPPPPPPPAPPAAPAPVAQNRPPTVRASCDPCTVEVGRTSTISADAQDPDGDPLTYQWTAASGTVTSPTSRQSPWTAPNQEGTVPVTVVVNDGRGGTARDTVNIQVTRPVQRVYTFEDVHFEFDRFTLLQDALRLLDEAVTAMQANSTLRLAIEGHTDNIGTAEYNLALGDRRATSVRNYLISRGIAADRITSVSYGEERPKFDNGREETRRLNRRAALVVRLQ